MPSQRRVKAFGLLIFLTVLITFYWTSAARQTRTSDFYTRTSAALRDKEDAAAAKVEAKAQEAAAHARDEDDISARLKAAEERAKQVTDEKGHQYEQQILSGNDEKADDSASRSVAGRVKIKDDKDGDTPGVARVGGNAENMEKPPKEKTDEENEIELELNSILKKGPIIIFSKSYCPYSKMAKHILLDLYKITPAPYVVELDEHPLGSGLQASLRRTTNRGTVPNILINGLSIGGGDDISALHESGKIAETITKMAGKRVTEVTLLPVKESSKDDSKEA